MGVKGSNNHFHNLKPFKPGKSGNPARQWRPGQSGNPAGKSALRIEFERVFTEALLNEGSPEECAKILWTAARKSEPWAVQAILQRLLPPEQQSVRLIHEKGTDHSAIDYSKLSDDELNQLRTILERAAVAGDAGRTEIGTSAPEVQ